MGYAAQAQAEQCKMAVTTLPSCCFLTSHLIGPTLIISHCFSGLGFGRGEKKVCVLGLGLLGFMVVKTLQNFHELALGKLEDDAARKLHQSQHHSALFCFSSAVLRQSGTQWLPCCDYPLALQ